MNKELAIECIKTQRQFMDDMTREAFDMAIDLIKEAKLHADVAPVVRCGDCKWRDAKEKHHCIDINRVFDKMGFCSFGERER